MLEHVSLHQTRFNTPGVAPDNRGIVIGKQAALLFSSVDRLVGFFRVFSDEASLDDLLAKLKIQQVRSPLEAREFVVTFSATSSYLVDRCARIARLFGGLCFTGSSKHFVKFRDDASPLGYDVAHLEAESADSDFVLYSDTFTQAYTRLKDIAFDQLVFRLSLRKLPRSHEVDERERDLLWLVIQPGLAHKVLGYLWRNRVRVEAAAAQSDGAARSAFAAARSLIVARVQDLPERMAALFAAVPGVELHRPISDGCVVQLGYRHPLRLESCASIFDKDKFYIFSGERAAVDVLRAPPSLVPAHDLIGVGFDLGERPEPTPRAPAAAPAMQVALRLVPASLESSRRRVTATLIPWRQADWLKRLVYAMPPTILSGFKVAAVTEGLFVVGEQGVDGVPLGEMYQEAAPSIYVPFAFEILPRVSPAVLSDQLGGTQGRYLVFIRGADRPLALEQALFEPLARRTVARLETDPRTRDPRLGPTRTPTPASVVNEESGAWPLWGWHDKPTRKKDA